MSKISVFCDESSIDERYMLIGGLWVDNTAIDSIRKDISSVRKRYSWFHEYKWRKVGSISIPQYKELIDAFFNNNISFHCIIIDNKKVDHNLWNNGDKELGFYKFYYTLLSNKLVSESDYSIFTDDRSNRSSSRLTDLRTFLTRTSTKLSNTNITLIQPTDSKTEDLIQLADILLGAVGYMWNNIQKVSKAKIEICKHIESFGNRLRFPTLPSEEKFNIWLFRSNKTKKRPGS